MKSHKLLFTAGALALTAIPLQAGNLGICFVTDTTADSVVRLEDLDSDGTYNGAGEVTYYYDETVGSIALSTPSGITMDAAGVIYVCDSGEDIVLALYDFNGDGDCNDAGEHWVFFDGNPGMNASGIVMSSASNITYGPNGRLWIASANTTTGADEVIWIQDLSVPADGDANDAGEAYSYFQPPGTGSICQDIKFDNTTQEMYYLENGTSGYYAKGIYILRDNDSSGFIDPYSEVFTFYNPTDLGNTPFHWGMAQGPDRSWFMADTGTNEVTWKVHDADDDDYITNATEEVQYYTSPVSSLLWMVATSTDGSLYATESQSPDRIIRMVDYDGSGMIDQPGEFTELYSDLLSPVDIPSPRGIYVVPVDEPGTAYCPGDGVAPHTGCPCSNNNDGSMSGCDWQTLSGSAGGALTAVGSGSIAANNTYLVATNVENDFGVFFGAFNQVNNGNGNVLNDGLRCAGGGLLRLIPPTAATGNQATTPSSLETLDASVAVGVTRRYQYWFRTPNGPCGQTANLTNGYEILWQP